MGAEDVARREHEAGLAAFLTPRRRVRFRESLHERRPLREAVEALMWDGAGFISCVRSRLGLYVSEDGSNVFILNREL